MDLSTLKNRVEALLKLVPGLPNVDHQAVSNELYQGALTVMSAFYGPESHQVQTLLQAHKEVHNRKEGRLAFNIQDLNRAVEGALRNLKAELEAGLAGSLQKRLTSEVLTDLVQLARTVLDQPGDNAKNVAAMLAAAAFEDTIRRMGSTFAGVMGKEDLEDVISALKTKGILVAPQLGIAIGYLNFRNRALHANWDQVERAAVVSVLAFVEELLLKHFQ